MSILIVLGLMHWRSHWSRIFKKFKLSYNIVSIWLGHFTRGISWFFAQFHTWLVLLLSASYDFHFVSHLAHFLFCRPWGPVTVGQENARQGSSMRTSWRTYSDFQCQRTSVGHSLQSPFRYIFHFNINVIMFLKHNELYFLELYFAAKTC